MPNEPATPTRRDFLKHVAAATTLASIALSPQSTTARTQPIPGRHPPLGTAAPSLGPNPTSAEADVEPLRHPWWQRSTGNKIRHPGHRHQRRRESARLLPLPPFPLSPPTTALPRPTHLYGEIAQAAHDDGLAVLARHADSSKAREPLYLAPPRLVHHRRRRPPLPFRRLLPLLHQRSPYYSQLTLP